MALYPQIERTSGGLVGTRVNGQMSIVIYDAATNLPANGNNMVVTYNQNINGAQTLGITQIVPGLSYPIYSGEISDSSTTTPFFTQFTIVSWVEGAISPDPAADDLVIVNVITTPETAIDADDGTVTVNATSSFPAILYSLDNTTWQSSNIFTGQLSGAGTAYAKDANSGLQSTPYTVDLLGNILVSDPTVDLGNGNLSRWNAAFNNIWFKYQRKDYEVTSITQDPDSNNILVHVNADMTNVTIRTLIDSVVPGQPQITSPGDFVYVSTPNYSGSYEVLSKTGGTLVLDFPYAANDTKGWININSLRPNYYVQTIITFVDPITGKFNTITSKNYPFPDGHCDVDLQSFLKSLLVVKDYSQYNLVNYRDAQLSASYTVKYAEVWTGNTPQYAAIDRPYYITFTARQLQQIGGGNMQEFIPYPLGFQPAKWLTSFVNPAYSNGFPFDLPFIFSEYMVGLAPFYEIILLDINKNPLTDQSIVNAFLLNEDGTFLLNQDGSKFIIASQALGGDIVERVGLNRLLIDFTPPDLCWYFSVQLKYTNTPVSGSPVTYPLTQAIICRVADRGNTTDRPVYLRWIGLTGSWEYFKFVYNQVVTLEVTNPVLIKNFVTDWQTADGIAEVISKNAGLKMSVYGENVTVSDIKGLQAIKFSPKVQLYTGQAVSGSWWQTVIVEAGTFNEYETFIDAYNFALTFALPQLNTQTQ